MRNISKEVNSAAFVMGHQCDNGTTALLSFAVVRVEVRRLSNCKLEMAV